MSLLVLYGSETGTAQDTAESLRREAEMRCIPARVYGLDEYDVLKLDIERVVIFVVSTTGQGEMPPNMRTAWRILLRKSLGSDFLKNVHVSVLALGDSSYQKYNFAGKKMYRRLLQLGAKLMTELGLADDQHEIGIDGAFIPWKENVWNAIGDLRIFQMMKNSPDSSVQIEPKYKFVEAEDCDQMDKCESEYHALNVVSNLRVTSENHFQETRLIRFEIPAELNVSFAYRPGDVLMVRPYNPDETVQIAIDALGYSDDELDRKVIVKKNNEFVRSPPYYLIGETTTLRKCLKRYFDLQQIPKRSFFEVLSYFSNDPMEKERLSELASPQGLDDLLDYSTRCRRTTAETLRDFPATAKNLKPDQLFELFAVIRPRAFSIASPPNTDFIELLVAKVEYKSRMADLRRGLCSTFISRLKESEKVFCKLRAGTFKFPSNESPVICVGPGTGVAPFRSLFGERKNCDSTIKESSSILFFGCRGEKLDFYFAEEWKNNGSVEVITAFSRDSDKKVYVQHKIAESEEKVRNVLQNGGYVFVAGSAGDMPKAVIAALNEVAGEDWAKMAEQKGMLQFETWS